MLKLYSHLVTLYFIKLSFYFRNRKHVPCVYRIKAAHFTVVSFETRVDSNSFFIFKFNVKKTFLKTDSFGYDTSLSTLFTFPRMTVIAVLILFGYAMNLSAFFLIETALKNLSYSREKTLKLSRFLLF